MNGNCNFEKKTFKHVVVINKNQQFTLRFLDAAQPRRCQPQFVLPDVPRIRMPRQIPSLRQSLLGAIVNDEQFPLVLRQCLRLERIQHTLQKVHSRIVRANDDGNTGHDS